MGLLEKVTFVQRLEGGEGVSLAKIGGKASRRQNQPMQTFKVGSMHDRVLCAKGQEAGAGWSRVDFKMKSEK